MPFKTKVLIGLGILFVIVLVFRDKVSKGVVSAVETIKNASETSTEKKRIEGLVPSAQQALRELRERLSAIGIRTLVGQTLRNVSEQNAVVSSGNSATKNSWHLVGRGVDLYPYDGDKPDLNGKRIDLFRTMHAEASKLGWRGLAFNPDGSKRYITTNKGKVWDGGHLEFPEGMTFAQAKASYSLA